jgi:hypothetical protein
MSPGGRTVSEIVYIVTAWDERTSKKTLLVFADQAKAKNAWTKLDGETVYGGVVRRTVKR